MSDTDLYNQQTETDLINDQYIPRIYTLALKQDDAGLTQLQSQADNILLTQAMSATYQVLLDQIYDLCADLIIEKRRSEDDEVNHAVEIFASLYTEPLDPETEVRREKTTPLFKAMRWILENQIKQKLPQSLMALEHTLTRYFNDTTTYAQAIIKGDLASSMLSTLNMDNVSEENKKQVYTDAHEIFGVSPRPEDFSPEDYMMRVTNLLLNISNASEIIFSARNLLKKSVDDQIVINDVMLIAQLLLPEMLGQKDDTLAYLVFPGEKDRKIMPNSQTTTSQQPEKQVSIDVS